MATPSVAVVTCGHSYDVVSFHRFFQQFTDCSCYIQHMNDFASSPEEVRDAYDVVLFYIMMMDGPKDDGLPWHAGKPKTALERLGATDQGIFVLHHALLAYPQWSVWNDIVGIPDRTFGYHMGQTIRVEAAAPSHPITRGLGPWDMVDETYTMESPGSGSNVLLSVTHEKSMRHIAWTRSFRNSRVFCFQSGHDNLTWANPSFREVVHRGILWCAGRL